MATHFRPAIAADIPALVDIECRAFGRDGAEAREHTRAELLRELADYVVLIDDESPRGAAGALQPGIVACARLQRHWLWTGTGKVLKGDVGHVAVIPEAQGRGYGTDLMQRISPHLQANGCHLARLGGLMKFYARFGYEPFLRRYVHIPVQPVDCDLKGCKWGDLHVIPNALADCLRIYNPSKHALAVHELRLRFSRERPGAPVLDETPPAPTTEGVNLKALDWVYEVDGEVRGFLRGGHGLVNAGDATPSY
ncbi:MAG: N-acetyltransferase, partial [Armatimonadota bacterium]